MLAPILFLVGLALGLVFGLAAHDVAEYVQEWRKL
jgi:hypothetical protein